MARPALSSDLDEIERLMRKRNVASSNKFLDALHLHHSPQRSSVTVDEIVEAPADRTRQIEPYSVDQLARSVDQWVKQQKDIYKPWFSIVEEIEPPVKKQITIREIQQVVSRYFFVSRAALLSAGRTADVVRPRHVAIYLSKILTPKSLPEIGRRFGGRDHSTVIHAIRRVGALIETSKEIREAVATLKLHLEVA